MSKLLLTKSSKIVELLLSQYKDRGTELNYTTEFELLCAVILSAQTTDKRVNIITPELFASANNPQQMINLGVDGIAHHIKSVGLYQAKSQYLYRMSKQLLENFHGQVPKTLEELLSLSGVGRKTANVILNTLCGHDVIAVDTHVFRVANRLGLSKGKTPLAVEQDLMKNIKKEYLSQAHNLFVLHGRYVCKSQKPDCLNCIVKNECQYYSKNISSKSSG